jgi:DNA repair exonuclease SbcCD ATPase subunit
VQRQLERLLSGQEALQQSMQTNVSSLRVQIGELVERLARGDERMQQMRAELDRTASAERVTHIEDDIREIRSMLASAARARAEEKRDERGRWAGVWPTIIATVAGGLLQAAVIGGIVAYALYSGGSK